MLRSLVALLLLANLGFLALSRGWLAPAFTLGSADQREPQRLATQIDPNSIQVLPAAAADAAQPGATTGQASCLQAGPFNTEQAAAAEAAVARSVPQAATTRVALPAAARWLLVVPRPQDGDADGHERQRLRDEGFSVETAGPASLSLGRYDDRNAADAALEAARNRGVRGLKLLEQPAAPRYWLQVGGADAALQARLQSLALEPAGSGFAPCGGPR